MGNVDRITTAGVIPVVTWQAGFGVVAVEVVETSEQASGPVGAGFASVIVDYVDNNFDAGEVKCFHHIPKFSYRIIRSGIAGFRSKEANRVVAPVVYEAFFEEKGIIEMLVHREKLHGGDPDLLEIANAGRVSERGIATTNLFRNGRIEI